MKRINITLFTLMLLGILFSCTKASINYTQNGNWVARAQWPGTQMGYGVAFVVGTHSYVGLGINPVSPNQRLVAFYQYTPSTFNPNLPTQYDSAYGVWAQVAPFPGPARSNAVAFAVQTIGYVGSGVGNDGFTPLSDFYDYNVAQNAWYQIDSIHDANQSYPRFDAAAWGFDTVGYVLTGTDNNYYFNDVWKYSPQTGHWTQKAYLPGNKRSGASTFVYNGKGYLLTGYTPGSIWSQNNMAYDFWEFDPAKAEGSDSTAVWKRLRDIYNTNAGTYDDGYTNIVRKYGATFIIKGTQTGDKGYITLGQNGTSLTYTWEYDFLSDLWTEKTPYEGTARSGAVGFTITDQNGVSRGFAGTGLSTGNTSGFSDLEEFFPNQIYNQYD